MNSPATPSMGTIPHFSVSVHADPSKRASELTDVIGELPLVGDTPVAIEYELRDKAFMVKDRIHSVEFVNTKELRTQEVNGIWAFDRQGALLLHARGIVIGSDMLVVDITRRIAATLGIPEGIFSQINNKGRDNLLHYAVKVVIEDK